MSDSLPDGSAVTVPLVAHPSWAPAWDPMRLGETLPRTLDATQWADNAGFVISGIDVSLDPVLALEGPPVVSGARCSLNLVAGGLDGEERDVGFVLHFAGGSGAAEDRIIVVRQPIRAGLPSGLVPYSPSGLPARFFDMRDAGLAAVL